MKSQEVRQKYINFFKNPPRDHIVIPSAPLVPENDPTTLFISAGMQPLISNILGQPHPSGKRLVNSQKAIRLQDIDEVGDNRHTTFFEMLGNWSFGDYFKKEQLTWIFQFLTEELGLDPKKLYVSVFEGDTLVPKDTESIKIWKDLFAGAGIEAKIGERIVAYPASKNWWSRSGEPEKMPPGEPGGPDSEVFYDFGRDRKIHESSPYKDKPCHPNCDCGRFLEIANSVFMQYQKQKDGSLKELDQKSVDFGGGLERLTAATIDDPDVYKIDIFSGIIEAIEKNIFINIKYGEKNVTESFRILADHIRAITFLLSENIIPSNKAQGYVLRRLIRRAVVQKYKWGNEKSHLSGLIDTVVNIYQNTYPEIAKAISLKGLVDSEEEKFFKTYKIAHQEWVKLSQSSGPGPWGTLPYGEGPEGVSPTAEEVFKFITTYGLPLEIIRDELHWKGDYKKVQELLKKHRDLSRSSSKGMFKGGLENNSKETTKYHTATHLLHQALRMVLGTHVSQKGSNITAERLRFDFSHPAKLMPEEIKKVEDMVNEKIKENLPVSFNTQKKEDALKSGALAFFTEKYGNDVKVYSIGNFSREICGGPHVGFTGELGHLTITKEESAGSGIRRIYAVLG